MGDSDDDKTAGAVKISAEVTSELSSLKADRQYLRQRITRKSNTIASKASELSLIECNETLDELKEVYGQLTSVDKKIGKLIHRRNHLLKVVGVRGPTEN